MKKQIANGDRNVCVKKIPEDWDHSDLFDFFSEFGEVASCKVSKTFKVTTIYNAEEGKQEQQTTADSNKYGYVSFKTDEGAKNACTDSKVKNKGMVAEPYTKERSTQNPNNLYVKNFPTDWDDNEFASKFSKFCSKDGDKQNNIISAKIMRDEKNVSKGFGFVCFSNPEDAVSAKKAMHGQKMSGCEEALCVEYALKKEVREKALRKALLR